MKKTIIKIAVILLIEAIILFILLIPIKDDGYLGDIVRYNALLYQIEIDQSNVTVKVLGITIFEGFPDTELINAP